MVTGDNWFGSMRDKLILTDCDGVMLDWMYSFDQWMKRHGYRIQNAGEYDIGKKYEVGFVEKKKTYSYV